MLQQQISPSVRSAATLAATLLCHPPRNPHLKFSQLLRDLYVSQLQLPATVCLTIFLHLTVLIPLGLLTCLLELYCWLLILTFFEYMVFLTQLAQLCLICPPALYASKWSSPSPDDDDEDQLRLSSCASLAYAYLATPMECRRCIFDTLVHSFRPSMTTVFARSSPSAPGLTRIPHVLASDNHRSPTSTEKLLRERWCGTTHHKIIRTQTQAKDPTNQDILTHVTKSERDFEQEWLGPQWLQCSFLVYHASISHVIHTWFLFMCAEHMGVMQAVAILSHVQLSVHCGEYGYYAGCCCFGPCQTSVQMEHRHARATHRTNSRKLQQTQHRTRRTFRTHTQRQITQPPPAQAILLKMVACPLAVNGVDLVLSRFWWCRACLEPVALMAYGKNGSMCWLAGAVRTLQKRVELLEAATNDAKC